MAKHSRGPWTYYSGPLRRDFPATIHEIHDATGREVVTWGGFDGGGKQDKKAIRSNCRLIAAAPELLAALKNPAVLYALGYVAEFAGDGGDHTEADGRKADAAMKAIRAAIASATRVPDRRAT